MKKDATSLSPIGRYAQAHFEEMVKPVEKIDWKKLKRLAKEAEKALQSYKK